MFIDSNTTKAELLAAVNSDIDLAITENQGPTNMTKITDKAIREYLGHNGVECRVRIARDGTITRYGAPEPTDRSKDFWALVGPRDYIVSEMQDGGK